MNNRLIGLSLFASAGIGETYFKECGIDIKVSNELVEKRAELYSAIYPDAKVVCGDITDEKIFDDIIHKSKAAGVNFILASPPCQGMSVVGKNRDSESMKCDDRNYLVLYAIRAIEELKPKYVLIENVSALLKIKLTYCGEEKSVLEVLSAKFGDEYEIDSKIVDSADYGVPQTRHRAIIKMNAFGTTWKWPNKEKKKLSVRDAIGDLPSLEAGESSNIKWHFARPHDPRHVEWMKHTATGTSAFDNGEDYCPRKTDGSKIVGYESSYRRIKWDEPAPTITIRNDAISSQRNVHPGRLLPDGTYSDARVLTPLELMILDSLPRDWNIPDNTPEILIRQCIGESIPPLMLKKIVKGIDLDNMNQKMKAISLFASAGIGELLLHNSILDVKVANELLPKRAECYEHFYPSTEMICGDITNSEIQNKLIDTVKKQNIKVLIATPPCQGLSTLGKNKVQVHYEHDPRNYLVLETLKIIDACDFDYIVIENVPKFIEMYFPHNGEYKLLSDILHEKYDKKYNVDIRVLNAEHYGVCQSRPRAIVKIFKKGLTWSWPKEQPIIPLKDAIGHLPSLEAGEDSGIRWHYAKEQNPRAVLALRHTAPGKSAIANEEYYPKKEDGTRIKGFHNTFKRMTWDVPCPTRTTFSGSMSSHNNVHPGRLLPDGTYSDARVLTLLETFIVSSIPEDIDFPKDSTDTFIRTMIGEAIPPFLMKQIVELIGR